MVILSSEALSFWISQLSVDLPDLKRILCCSFSFGNYCIIDLLSCLVLIDKFSVYVPSAVKVFY